VQLTQPTGEIHPSQRMIALWFAPMSVFCEGLNPYFPRPAKPTSTLLSE
jgi:hypothetical protein